jgi:hypothetical protein
MVDRTIAAPLDHLQAADDRVSRQAIVRILAETAPDRVAYAPTPASPTRAEALLLATDESQEGWA